MKYGREQENHAQPAMKLEIDFQPLLPGADLENNEQKVDRPEQKNQRHSGNGHMTAPFSFLLLS